MSIKKFHSSLGRMIDTSRFRVMTIEPKDLEERKTSSDERKSKEERQQKHPFGPVQIPLGANHLIRIVVSLCLSGKENRE